MARWGLSSHGGNRDLCVNRGVNINLNIWNLDRDNEGIAGFAIPFFKVGLLFPPTTNWKDPDCVALGKIRSSSRPEIRVKRALIAYRRPEKPLIATGAPSHCFALFFLSGSVVDAGPKIDKGLGRFFNRKPEAMGGISVATGPPPLTRVRFDEI